MQIVGSERYFDHSVRLQQGNGDPMKKTALVSTCVISVILFVASLIVVITPVTAYAATCTAECRTGSVSCTGGECSAEDFKGCKYTVGGREFEKKCDLADELEIQ